MFGSCDGFGFAAGVMGRDGVVGTGGFVWEGSEMIMLDDVVVRTEYDGDAVASLALDLRAGDRSWSLQGLPQNAVPLRNRRPDTGQVTRILETAVRWSSDGHEMLGIAEYLDQVIDGRPVGIAEHDLAVR
jgi:hypothetical protein